MLEMKNAFDRFIRKFSTAKNKKSKLGDTPIEIGQTERPREKRREWGRTE